MLTKEALEKVAAAEERDQATAIEIGFESACADMGLDRPHAKGLAKVARARLAEFKKLAGETLADVTAAPANAIAGAGDAAAGAVSRVGGAATDAIQGAIDTGTEAFNAVKQQAPGVVDKIRDTSTGLARDTGEALRRTMGVVDRAGPQMQGAADSVQGAARQVKDTAQTVQSVAPQAGRDLTELNKNVSGASKAVTDLSKSTQRITDFVGSPMGASILAAGGGAALLGLGYLVYKGATGGKKERA